MSKITGILLAVIAVAMLSLVPSCNTDCVDEILLQTIKMDLEVNHENLGVGPSSVLNTVDTIRSDRNQFYNNPDFRRFGYRYCPRPTDLFITSAYAQSECLEQIDYISRMDPALTEFSINKDYNASAVGLGMIPSGTDFLQVEDLKNAYLTDFDNNVFLNGGAPAPLNIEKSFFQAINNQWVTFYFNFTEIDGSEFSDSTVAFIDIEF